MNTHSVNVGRHRAGEGRAAFPPFPAALFAGIACLAPMLAQAAEPKFSDTIEQRVLACTPCHGKQGEGLRENVYYPRIGAKPAEYLYRQLVNFRDGRRHNPQMGYLVRYLSDDYLLEIAEYFSKLRPVLPGPTKPSVSAAALARGEALVTRGDPAKDLPACADCHGKALTGLQPGIPGLLGHYPDYLSAQLTAWKNGSRQADAPDCMSQIASRLSGADISAVAAWLAAQPPGTATAAPAATKGQKLPLDCGSQPMSAGR